MHTDVDVHQTHPVMHLFVRHSPVQLPHAVPQTVWVRYSELLSKCFLSVKYPQNESLARTPVLLLPVFKMGFWPRPTLV